jgi:plastocyanin
MKRALFLTGAAGTFLAAPLSFAGEAIEVGIAEYRFAPAELKIRRGTTVTWVNREKRTSHSVLFLEPGAAESDRLFPGDTWSRTFDRPGRFKYRCGPHEEMEGVVEVTE